jgi:hypothetical protein
VKTLITAKHDPGPHINGYDRCHARIGDGMCPGIETAHWLNSLGNDDDLYITIGGQPITNGQVRDNWLKSHDHIVAVEPALAALKARERRIQADLRIVRSEIKRVERIVRSEIKRVEKVQ